MSDSQEIQSLVRASELLLLKNGLLSGSGGTGDTIGDRYRAAEGQHGRGKLAQRTIVIRGKEEVKTSGEDDSYYRCTVQRNIGVHLPSGRCARKQKGMDRGIHKVSERVQVDCDG